MVKGSIFSVLRGLKASEFAKRHWWIGMMADAMMVGYSDILSVHLKNS